MLRILELSKIYFGKKNKLAVDKFSYDFPSTGLFYICGKNGTGKSTLLQMICGDLQPSSGKVILDEDDRREYLKENVFYLNYLNYLPTLSVKENIELVLNTKFNSDEIEKYLILLDLKKTLELKAHKLSGGEKQRLCILLAVLQDKKVLLFDEPTSNLDLASAAKVYDLLSELGTNHLIIFTEHDMEKIPKHIDYVSININHKEDVSYDSVTLNYGEQLKETNVKLSLLYKRRPFYHYLICFLVIIITVLPVLVVFLGKDSELTDKITPNVYLSNSQVLVISNDAIDTLKPKYDFEEKSIREEYYSKMYFEKHTLIFKSSKDKYPGSSNIYFPRYMESNVTRVENGQVIAMLRNGIQIQLDSPSFSSNDDFIYLPEDVYKFCIYTQVLDNMTVIQDGKEIHALLDRSLAPNTYYGSVSGSPIFHIYYEGREYGTVVAAKSKAPPSLQNISPHYCYVNIDLSYFSDVDTNLDDNKILTFKSPYQALDAYNELVDLSYAVYSPFSDILYLDTNGNESTFLLIATCVSIILSFSLVGVLFILIVNLEKLQIRLSNMLNCRATVNKTIRNYYLFLSIPSAVLSIVVLFILYEFIPIFKLVSAVYYSIFIIMGIFIQSLMFFLRIRKVGDSHD